jgi:hypothetical protein
MDTIDEGLQKLGTSVRRNFLGEDSYLVRFPFDGDVAVDVELIFDDLLGHSRMCIFTMQVLPGTEVKRGYGAQALKQILAWAESVDITEVWATYVFNDMEGFWTKMGFVKVCSLPNNFRLHNPRE